MRTYILTLSKVFPKTHKRAGEPTEFKEAFWNGQPFKKEEAFSKYRKLHTIRKNYVFWKKRMWEINHGQAQLRIAQWIDKPYRSKQEEITTLDSDDLMTVQKLTFQRDVDDNLLFFIDDRPAEITIEQLAANDGLSLDDWMEWFKNYDRSEPMAIIQFTKFRY